MSAAIDSARAQLDTIRQQLDAARAELRGQIGAGLAAATVADRHVVDELSRNRVAIDAAVGDDEVAARRPWSHAAWSTWEPDHAAPPRWIRIGDLLDQGEFVAPALVPFVGSDRPIVIRTRGGDAAARAKEFLQSIALRVALSMPHQVRVHLIDPIGMGRSFPLSADIPGVVAASGDIAEQLAQVAAYCQRVTDLYPDVPLADLPDELRMSERFNLVVAADIPNGCDRRALDALRRVVRFAPAGALVVVHHDLDVDTRDAGGLDLGETTTVDIAGDRTRVEWGGLACELRLDSLGGDLTTARERLGVLSRFTPVQPRVTWASINQTEPSRWWQHSSLEAVTVPIGQAGPSQLLELTYGEVVAPGPAGVMDRQVYAHTIQAGMPGMGKSIALHSFITGAATRYGPDEVAFYLIDGKQGVEFRIYRDLPHARLVSLKTQPEMMLSVLLDAAEELDRRFGLFDDLGVEDNVRQYSALRAAVDDRRLPRLVIIVDEYHELFGSTIEQSERASNALKKIAAQGRAAGVHLFLVSQRFVAQGMVGSSAMMENMHNLVALGQSEQASLVEFGKQGRDLIKRHCDSPGKAVVNSRAGADAANRAGRIAMLDDAELSACISDIRSKADAGGYEDRRPIVFVGDCQPFLRANAALPRIAALRGLDAQSRRELAESVPDRGGLGIAQWHDADRPVPLLLGKGLSVHGQAIATLSRRRGGNLLIVGQDLEIVFGACAAGLTSVALSMPAGGLEMITVVASRPGDWTGLFTDILPGVSRDLGHDAHVVQPSGLADTLGRLVGLIDERRDLDPQAQLDARSVMLVILEPEYIAALEHVRDAYGDEPSDLGRQLGDVLDRGPTVGVHVVVVGRSVVGLTRVLQTQGGNRHMSAFDHKMVLQCGEDDSFTVLGTADARTVQGADAEPVKALLADAGINRTQICIPFTVEDQRLPAGDRSGLLQDQIAAFVRDLA